MSVEPETVEQKPQQLEPEPDSELPEQELTADQLFDILNSNNEEIQKLRTSYSTHIPTSVLLRKIMMSSYVALSKLRKLVLETKKAIPVKKRGAKKESTEQSS